MCKATVGQKIKVRRLTISDYDRIVEIWKSAGLPFKPRGRDSRSEIKRQMEATPDLFLGAEENGRLVGVIIASTEVRKGWLNRIAVIPEERGKDIAKILTVSAEKALRKRGIKIIGLLIHRENIPSINLAKTLGYKVQSDILYLTKRENEEV